MVGAQGAVAAGRPRLGGDWGLASGASRSTSESEESKRRPELLSSRSPQKREEREEKGKEGLDWVKPGLTPPASTADPSRYLFHPIVSCYL